MVINMNHRDYVRIRDPTRVMCLLEMYLSITQKG